MNDYLALIMADERVRIYPEGSIGYDTYMANVGWILNEFDGHGGTGPTLAFIRIAEAARLAYLAEEIAHAEHDTKTA